MKIGVMSDSHDHMPMIQAALDLFAAERVEAMIHAGDFVAPFAAKLIATFKGPLYTVYGNNDGEQKGLAGVFKDVTVGPLQIGLGGRQILVHHWIEQAPPELMEGADIVITGHTHEVVNERRDGEPGRPFAALRAGSRPRLMLNPGECCGWLTGQATAAILDTDALSARIVALGQGRSWKVP